MQMFPPCGCEEQSWTCEQTDWQIVLKEEGNFTGCIMESRTDFQNKDEEDCQGGEFIPEYIIDFDKNPELTLQVRAKVMVPASADIAASLLSNVDLTQQLTQVTFRLPTGPCLFLDKRVLVARSEYFRKMLTEPRLKEGQTSEVDLSQDSTINCKAMTALLRFIMSDTFVHPEDPDDYSYYFDVRKLADRYQQKDLMIRTETAPGLGFG